MSSLIEVKTQEGKKSIHEYRKINLMMESLHTSLRVVYWVVTEANPGIMSCRHDMYPSQHYIRCCRYPDGLEIYRV